MGLARKNETDMTKGSLFKKLIIFTFPIILTNVMQFLFNVADMAVLGIMPSGGDTSVAAVGSTASLVSLVTCLFVGLSIGGQVVLSRKIGEGNVEGARKTVGTAIIISLISGVILVAIGIPLARVLLKLMKCPDSIIDLATLYLVIYFSGMPAVLMYNFLSSIMRAVGDSMRPMIILAVSGILNVGLNVFFMAVFKMNVQGVAIGTVVSQLFSAIVLLILVLKNKGYARLEKKYFRIDKTAFKEILKVGIPSGVNSALYAVSNMLIQSAVNSFGEMCVAGNSSAYQIDNVIYISGCSSVGISCMTALAQNVGAGNVKRAKQSFFYACLISLCICVVLGTVATLLSNQINGIFVDSPQALEYAFTRTLIRCPFMFLCGFYEVTCNSLKAIGKATQAMIVSFFGACVFRVVWVLTVCKIYNSYALLQISYPISHLLVSVVCFIILWRNIKKIERERLGATE